MRNAYFTRSAHPDQRLSVVRNAQGIAFDAQRVVVFRWLGEIQGLPITVRAGRSI